MAQNEPLAQIAPSAVELQLRLGDIGPSRPGGASGSASSASRTARPGVARRTLLARLIGQEPRLRDLRLAQIGLGLLGAGLRLLRACLGFHLGLVGRASASDLRRAQIAFACSAFDRACAVASLASSRLLRLSPKILPDRRRRDQQGYHQSADSALAQCASAASAMRF